MLNNASFIAKFSRANLSKSVSAKFVFQRIEAVQSMQGVVVTCPCAVLHHRTHGALKDA